MSSKTLKPATLAGAVVLASLALSASAFAFAPLAQGYALAATAGDKPAEGNCGADKAAHEGKCGEGKCGMSKMDSDKDGKLSATEFAAAHKGDGSKFASYDADKDGFITDAEMKAAHAAKSGDKPKAAMEGKCGEGKCGGMGS